MDSGISKEMFNKKIVAIVATTVFSIWQGRHAPVWRRQALPAPLSERQYSHL